MYSYISYSWTYAAVSLCINQSHDTYYKTLFNSLSFFIIILAIDRILISTPKTLRMKLGIIFFSICCCCCCSSVPWVYLGDDVQNSDLDPGFFSKSWNGLSSLVNSFIGWPSLFLNSTQFHRNSAQIKATNWW